MNRGHDPELALSELIKNDIRWRVQSGFYTSDDIIDTVAGSMTGRSATSVMNLQTATKLITPFVAAEWAAQLERQLMWPEGPTVADKLTEAFESLERNHKILGRSNFTCCQTCGHAEIGADSDDDTRGYVFFHEQDTEHAVRDGDLYLAYDSFAESSAEQRAVGEIVVKSLREEGLDVEWEGNTGRRILLRCGEWRNRHTDNEGLDNAEEDDCYSEYVPSDEYEDRNETDTQSDLRMEESGNAGYRNQAHVT